MTLGSILMDVDVFVDKLGGDPAFHIRLPAVPRMGETITLPDDHYLVEEVYWQANVPATAPQAGYLLPDQVYYTIRMVVKKKFQEQVDG